MTYKMWTKDEVRRLLDMWESTSVQEIADELERTRPQIIAMASKMRKVGFRIPHKHRRDYLNHMLEEVLRENKKR